MSDQVGLGKTLLPGIFPWLLGVAALLLIVFTAPHYGLVWDEPNYFHASDLEIQWGIAFGRNLIEGKAAKSLDDDVIRAAWYWDPYHVPHPPFSRILSGLTKAVFSPVMDKFTAYRLAPALLFALLVAAMYQWMGDLYDRLTGLFAALSLLTIPNLFGFAHFAVTDMPLTTLWFITVYCFWKGLKDWKWSLVLALVWGLALATKFPAFLIPIPLLIWAHLYHRRDYANNLFAMIFLSPIVMVSCQPYLWHQTLPRIVTFLYDSVSRGFRPETSFPIFFLGEYYASDTVPRYYPFFMTAVTMPEITLLLSLLGGSAVLWLKPQHEITILFLLNAVFIPTTGLLPGAVLHDVNRLTLPILPFLAGLAGCGFFLLMERLTRAGQKIAALQKIPGLGTKLAAAAALLLLAPSTAELIASHPYELSYYNRLVGGIPGAYRRGLEVTYFMEAFTPGFLRYFNERMPRNATINATFSDFMFQYYQQEGLLRRDLRITDKGDFDYYVLLNRRSTFSDDDRAFLATRPVIHDVWRVDGVPFIYILRPRHQ